MQTEPISKITNEKKDKAWVSESAMCFLDLQTSKKNYSKKLSWAWNLDFKFRIVFWNVFFFLEIERFEKRITLTEKSHI